MGDREFTGASFYKFLGEEKLMGSRCGTCGTLHVPPRGLCSACFGEQMVWEQMSGDGTLLAFTTVHIAPTAMIEAGYDRKNPYCAGIVGLAEGPAMSAQILGIDPSKPQDIHIGMPLRAAFYRRGEGEHEHVYLAFEG